MTTSTPTTTDADTDEHSPTAFEDAVALIRDVYDDSYDNRVKAYSEISQHEDFPTHVQSEVIMQPLLRYQKNPPQTVIPQIRLTLRDADNRPQTIEKIKKGVIAHAETL